MDLGVVGLEGLVGFSDSERKKNSYDGSGFLKQERSEKIITSSGDCDCGDKNELLWKGSKIAKIDDNNNNNKDLLLLKSNNNNNSNNDSTMFDGHQQQILSFSSIPKSETSPNAATLPCSYNTLSRNNNPGCYSYGAISIRGGFTPSQWMELEHQALIYKYITANVPVPSHLLIPIRKALDSASALFCFSNGLLRPNSLGWGAFHLGYSNNTDPEPGRCRRTDGKKWRCSRDAVVDQKYCERHMNRGRHRSRKPVEHALNNTNTSSNNNNNNNNGNKINGSSASSSSFSMGIGNNGSSNIITFGGQNQEHKNMHNLQNSLASDASVANNINRVFMNNNNKQHNNATNSFMILHHHKHHQIQYEEESSSPSNNNNNNIEFGLVTSDSLLNPSRNNTTTTTTTLQNHSLRNFIDDCPKIQSSLFTSSPSQNNDEKLTLSPLRLSRELELDPIQMGLGVGVNFINESSSSNSNTRQGNSSNWNMIPISTNWESSMCGPLGEVLNLSNSNNNSNANNDKCANNNNSPNSIGSSPTGVFQKTTFGSVSNSSAGSSPRAENNIKVLCNGNVSSSLPAL